jgi:hypothetical protein
MAQGPGKYDDLATYCREQAEAVAGIVIILEGKHGSGFSMQSLEPEVQRQLPALLENIAAQIREDNRKMGH